MFNELLPKARVYGGKRLNGLKETIWKSERLI